MSIKLKHSRGNSVSLNPPTSAPTSSEVAFKLPNADGSADQVIKTDGSGNLGFTTAATNTPAFSAGPAHGDTLSDDAWHKVVFTEIMDSDNKFANGTTFTPGVAGYYMYYANVYMYDTSSADVYSWKLTIFKNGSDVSNAGVSEYYSDNSDGDRLAPTITGIIYLDADDYIECYASANTTGGTWAVMTNHGSFGAFKLAGVS